MQLHNYISQSSIYQNINVTDKLDLFQLISQKVQKHPIIQRNGLSSQAIQKAIEEREAVVPTGIGMGIAMPHARLESIDEVVVELFILSAPITYQAVDNLPIQIAVLILIPESQPSKGLKIMAQFARLFSTQKEQLLAASNKEAIYTLIKEQALNVEEPLLARDIMTPVPFQVYQETPLKDVTKQMESFRVNGIPVINSQEELVGEITCKELFNIGIPEFFKSLKSVSFVSYFDPFEDYFKQEATAKAEDVMQRVKMPLSPESTILEIVYQLAVKHVPVLYVVENNKLVGMIDPNTVMNRIINY